VPAEPYIGEIMLVAYNFAPRGWADCNGQLLPISQYTALFSLLGTTYGGNGQTSFGLPDLRGRVPVHAGTGPGLGEVALGEVGGAQAVTLLTSQMPTHSHGVPAPAATNDRATTNRPDGKVPARGGSYADGGSDHLGTSSTTNATGQGQPHENRPPFLGLRYVIALEGIYPSRD